MDFAQRAGLSAAMRHEIPYWAGVTGAVLALAALGLSHAGALHPAADSLAVFRPVIVLGLVPCLYLARRARALAMLGTVAAAVALGPAMWLARPAGAEPTGALVLYQKNLLWSNDRLGALAEDIMASGADVVTLQEVSRGNRALLGMLADAYPGQALCESGAVGAVAVLARAPFAAPPVCIEGQAMVLAQVAGPEGPVWVGSVHLSWPWPWPQARQAERLAAKLEALEGPRVIAGDFNMVAWGRSVRRMSAASGTRPIGPVRRSFVLMGVYPLAIDHVLAGAGRLEARARLGSDHFGLLARVVPAPGPVPEPEPAPVEDQPAPMSAASNG